MEKDTLGYPKRKVGESYIYSGREFIILENQGLTVLCPCGDTLKIRYTDTGEETYLENNNDFEQVKR